MFGKKANADPRKATLKFQDAKKDTATRLKHLRHLIETVDVGEAKILFEANYSNVYYVFYDQFISVETNLRQRAQKSYREELDVVLSVFEKILVLLPELLARRWQWHSIHRLMKKLLHPGNALKLRREAVRLFLLWYQILNENAPPELHNMFACLVPGFSYNSTDDGVGNAGPITMEGIIAGTSVGSLRHCADFGVVSLLEITPILLPQSGDRQVEDQSKFFLECLMDFMVTQVTKIEWRDKNIVRQQKSFNFLFESFKRFYLPVIFPNFNWNMSLYKPCLDLPELVPFSSVNSDVVNQTNMTTLSSNALSQCKVVVVRWIASFTHCIPVTVNAVSNSSVVEEPELTKESRTPSASDSHLDKIHPPVQLNSGGGSFSEKESNLSYNSREDHTYVEHSIVRNTLYHSRENVNLVHEVFRQALLLRWTEAATMRRVICVYRDWITMQTAELPSFMLEPNDALYCPSRDEKLQQVKGVGCFIVNENMANFRSVCRFRNDSYLGAIYRENLNIRAGLQNTLQVFITHAANVFLQEIGPADKLFLDDQVDMCKRVLNIYRFIVMNITMEQKTWEQLLLILLHITSQILGENLPAKKEETLGGRLAPAVFQTLIVTWIKANLNVVISTELWDQFLHVLSSLTRWEELIREWAKTMETLTRVLAKMVYGLDLNDLPLDRLSEQKQKKRRGRVTPSRSEGVGSGLLENQHGPGGSGLRNQESGSNVPTATPSPFQQEQNTPDSMRSILRTKNGSASEYRTTWQDTSSRSRSSSGGVVDVARSKRSRSSRSERVASISRSVSEGNLSFSTVASTTTKTSSAALYFSRESSSEPTDSLPNGMVMTASAEQEMAKMIATVEEYIKDSNSTCSKVKSVKRSRSMDSLRFARASTPSSISESSMDVPSRSPSPSPSTGLESNSIKDSPMQIDVIGGDQSCPSEMWMDVEREELRSVMSGGSVSGWLPDVSVALWRRMLGALGDVNLIENPETHAHVFQHLIDLFDTLIKIRENQGIPSNNQLTPPPPEFIPPLNILAPWLFKAICLPDQYKKGKLCAYHLLCTMTVRRHDISLSRDHLVQFYGVIHSALSGNASQDVVNTIVRHCGPRIFSLGLPGSTMLILDFIHAADMIASSADIRGVPRTEAMAVLGACICLPNIFTELPVLHKVDFEFGHIDQKTTKDEVVGVLLKAGRREPVSLARCFALNSLAIYLYEELSQRTKHGKIRDAFNVLLASLRISNKMVAKVACDMLHLMTDHMDALLKGFPEVPKKIVEVLAMTLHDLLPRNDFTPTSTDKELIVAMLFCLAEWCMRMPRSFLTERDMNHESLLLTVFKVFNSAVTGNASVQRSSATLVDLASPEFNLGIHADSSPTDKPTGDSHNLTTVKLEERSRPSSPESITIKQPSPILMSSGQDAFSLIRLAARTVMTHLVNHLGHFPMGIGAVRLTSLVCENDDVPGINGDDLTSDVFYAPNIQFFVLNNQTLISFVELPSLDVPGGGVTAGLTTGRSQVRIILRDMSGKFSWDNSILYGPPNSRLNEYNVDPVNDQFIFPNEASQFREELFSVIDERNHQNTRLFSVRQRPPNVLPIFEDTEDDMDNLNDLLQYIGHTSPECLYHSGQMLNVAQDPPPMLLPETQEEVMTVVLNQRNYELNYLGKHLDDNSLMARPAQTTLPIESESPFQYCRLLINQLGFMAWEKRTHFDLLKKDEKLLRELRNLDNQKCRETHKIAVIYVAEGQEDKNSLLLNAGGCQAYEEFVAGLAWEVELKTHTGFMGGLQANGSTGDTAPYYATSFLEVIFHVATRMPSNNEESKIQKLRHLGNDEIHIVWSEHSRDYRRGIITTEFGDVLIVIYPMPNRLYRIQISQKPGVPFFGPLFDGAIVGHKVLPGLVRATAINASRATRSMMPVYQHFYKERAKALEIIVKNHTDPTTFEDFTSRVVLPATSRFLNHPSRISGQGFNKYDSTNVLALSNLAAALLDSHTRHASAPYRSRPSSLSSCSEQSTPAASAHEVHFRGSESFDCADLDDHNKDSKPTSPKAPKRRSFKSNPRRSQVPKMAPTPPESPPQRGKK